ncbi:MAG: cell envelope integrity protein TolA [Bacilli bacterium]|jgi:hypothetical protein
MAKPKDEATLSTPQTIAKLKKKYVSRLERMASNDADFLLLLQTFANAKNTYSGVSRREIKSYSEDFITEIENTLPSLEAIVNDPRRFIKEEAEIVGVEKARKITQRSVEHMAQHTENIRSVTNDGAIDPKKVLNMFIDDELKIYENRFIMTLVRRLQAFVELRYKYIFEHSDTRNSDVISVASEVKIGEVTYEYEAKMKIIVPSDDDGHRETNKKLLDRLLLARKRITYLSTSRFMLEMRKATPVSDPVSQTNIMRLNYDYQNAYKLWVFINRYDVLGIDYKFTQQKVDFDKTYMTNLHMNAIGAYLTFKTDHSVLPDKDAKQYVYKPRFKEIKLDYDMTDDRLFGQGKAFGVEAKKESQAMIEARERRKQQVEERRRKREEDKVKAKELALLKREQAKKLALQKTLEQKEREKFKKLALQDKKRKAALDAAEKKRVEKIRRDEEKKLLKAREQVRLMAEKRRKKE